MASFENSVVVAKNLNFDMNGPKPHLGIVNAAGKILIGTGNSFPTPEILAGSITSPDNSITISYSSPNITAVVAGGSTVGKTITGNTGTINPTLGNWNIVTANSTVKFVGAVSTLTQDFGLSNLVLGSSATSITSGVANTGLGSLVLTSITSGNTNTCVGFGAGAAITTPSNNTLIGAGCGDLISTSPQNTGLGAGALGVLTTGSGDNVAIGYNSLDSLATGSFNVCIGFASGSAYTTNESDNIIIGVVSGTIGESNITRIGGTQTDCYLSGILHTTSGRTVKITTPGAYPYATLTTDYVILVDTSSARTINPIASPTTGTVYVIKDNVGSAAANNITITPTGKNIDGAASYAITINYGSVTIVYNGTQWNVI